MAGKVRYTRTRIQQIIFVRPIIFVGGLIGCVFPSSFCVSGTLIYPVSLYS